MVLAQVAAHHQYALQVGQRGDGGAQPADAASDVAEVGMAQAMVDVLAAEAADQGTSQGQFLDGYLVF
jgi:hypothetical protein